MSHHISSLKQNKQHGFNAIVNINAPKNELWAVLEDFNNVYQWAPGVSKSHALGDKRQEVGAARYCKLEDFGEIDEVITEWHQGEGFTYTVSALGPLNNAVSRWTLMTVDANTTQLEVEFAYDIRFGIFGKMMHALVMQKKLHTSLPQTLQDFKNHMESGKANRPLNTQASTVAAH
ncbi:hypothetical protein A9R00_05615 [Oleispira antarctica]|uniref:Polyketide cyclase n=1 Tax=Oleispira antarctica TaxID=188908 RepID=A0A1Y5HTC0_OLEAN|nr:hypothetical protein A9R00_05615 [Oleispira antarctica]